jgi:hypothetical protein
MGVKFAGRSPIWIPIRDKMFAPIVEEQFAATHHRYRLEQDSNRLNQKEDSHIWRFVIQDAGWGWGPA